MGFSTVDSVINAASVNGKMQRLCFNKVMPSVSVANVPHTLWKATGLWPAGTDGTLGKANGRVLTDASTGGVVYSNAVNPATMHLISLGAAPITASATGTLILCDRIADCQLAHAETTGSITGMTATSRLAATTAPGDGGQLWCEVTSAFSAASNTITFQATDQLGNTAVSLAGMVTTASAIVGRSPNAKLWQDLVANVTGIRALTNVTLTSGTATGQYNACIVKPLATIPLPAVSTYVERDLVVEIPNIPLLYDDTCFQLIFVPTAAVTATIFGELRICSN